MVDIRAITGYWKKVEGMDIERGHGESGAFWSGEGLRRHGEYWPKARRVVMLNYRVLETAGKSASDSVSFRAYCIPATGNKGSKCMGVGSHLIMI